MYQICLLISFLVVFQLYAATSQLQSPDQQLQVTVDIGQNITYSVSFHGVEIIKASPISLTLAGGKKLGKNPELLNQKRRSQNEILKPVVRVKSSAIKDTYNELELMFKNSYALILRAYDDGFAWRFKTTFSDEIIVASEEVTVNFAGDYAAYFPTEESFISHNERNYDVLKISDISRDRFCSLPVYVNAENRASIVITESDLDDYPGLYFRGNNDMGFYGKFPPVVLETKPGPGADRDEVIVKEADYIAKTTGSRTYPWRVFIVGEKDGNLLESELVYKLAKPVELENTSWIKPGKVAWDWWNANNIYGVDFRAGINTETYKYYIDFASAYGLEYIILDENWSEPTDLLKQKGEINVEELCRYGKEKNVGVILWVLWKPLDSQLNAALDQFVKWGAKGIKVDFMQRNDQWMVNYYHKIAKEAAKRKLLVDFHGAYKPCGLSRAYPNVITREGVKGLEHTKWSDAETPEHNVTLPFTRMVAGPMDYTPGAMRNAQARNFRSIFERPMSMGTRCHQLAMYVVYESPLQMLCDSPSNYLREQECMRFLSVVPTVWDETLALDGKIADYVVVARRHGSDWYVGAMTDWSSRELEIDCSFLGDGEYQALIYEDGINAERYASDYKMRESTITKSAKLKIKLAPGGGWVARLAGK